MPGSDTTAGMVRNPGGQIPTRTPDKESDMFDIRADCGRNCLFITLKGFMKPEEAP
ncbi:MAG: hypothetical protein JW781_06060 [Deltaproteobacteria bacterium]|nr:hypothetical protein [Candidatus Anaeroferrophillacea bacterium]